MGWTHRVMVRHQRHSAHYEVHEVFVDARGKVTNVAEEPLFFAESLEELIEVLDVMRAACDVPLLDSEGWFK